MNRKWAFAVIGLMMIAGVSGSYAWSAPKANYLTFGAAVALPEVTLPAGTYIFEVVAPGAMGDVVRVSNRAGRHYFLGFTRNVELPGGRPVQSAVAFGEAPEGTPPPIDIWYPKGGSKGHQFIYGDAR